MGELNINAQSHPLPLEQHPCLSYYGQTRASSFPLLMVVGRAPNCNQLVAAGVAGPYHFIKRRIPPVWSLSYGLAAQHHKLGPRTTGTFRAECTRLDVSPIVYADAIPRGVPNGQSLAQAASAFTQQQLHAHVDGVFSLTDLLSRVDLVILSGLRSLSPPFNAVADAYEDSCRTRGITCIDLPFFYGNNMPALRAAWSGAPQAQSALTKIMARFP